MVEKIMVLNAKDLLKNKAKRIIEVNQNLSFKELKQKLQRKEVPEFVIDEVLVLDELHELENAIRLVRIKSKTVKGKNPIAIRQKLVRYLMSKGFNYDISAKALSALNSD
jgi:SOS response regulatory protein OraA/RecX